MRARGLVVEVGNARRMPFMARAVAAERLTAEAALLILELAEAVEGHATAIDAIASSVLKIADHLEKRGKPNA